MQDNLYKKPLAAIKPFSFDEKVADVFPDMIARSVPGYHATLQAVATVTRSYAQKFSNLYDLGCSLGAATAAMAQQVSHEQCQIIAVDNSAAMIARCKKQFARDSVLKHVQLYDQDIQTLSIENASVVILHYTLQFIPLEQRAELLKNIYNGLRPNGILLLAEKFSFEDPIEASLLQTLHEQFKRLHGYDDMEIAQKRQAIENVLVPETINTHQQRLRDSGFATSYLLTKHINFGCLLAIK